MQSTVILLFHNICSVIDWYSFFFKCPLGVKQYLLSTFVWHRDKTDDAGQNLTIKPTAFMKLYSNGVDISGCYILS